MKWITDEGTKYAKVCLETPNGAEAIIYLHGAHLASVSLQFLKSRV